MFLSVIKTILSLGLSYIIGSIPTAYLAARFYQKIDIRQYGSGNVGATNAFRVLGRLPGIAVLLADILKGLICPTLVADCFGQVSLLNRLILGTVAVAGHNWTVFLRFKGGKGMATSLGVLIGLAIKVSLLRPVLLLCVIIWLAVFLLSGFVSLSSLIAGLSFPVLLVIFSAPIELVIMGVVICAFVVLRHRPNISRLLRREEPRVLFSSFKKK